MTNFEYYKEEILDISKRGASLGMFTEAGKVKVCECNQTSCNECGFHTPGRVDNCSANRMKWLYEEHIEPPKQPKLTKKERQFCELVERGWIARDSDERLYYFKEEPAKNARHKRWEHVPFSKVIEIDQFDDCYFYFITWDDAEPWSIEDLLKLEVEE